MIAALALLALPMAAQAVTTHTIIVGGPGVLAFNPSSITAEVGDMMHFIFHQKNHTVTQSSFASPCTPFTDPTTNAAGFNSGFQPVPDSMTDGFPTCDWEVKTDKPLWAYCAQTMPAPHCSKGMVFSVNAPSSGNTFQAFQAAANATGSSTGNDPYGGGGYGSPAPAGSGSAPAPSGTASAPAPSGSGTVHTVKVGETGLTFDPPRLDAVVGDKVIFQFYPKNHTVTQSSFASPCSKLAAPLANMNQVLDSGFQATSDPSNNPSYSIDITTTSPLWFYCQQGGGAHCAAGMVFAINSVESSPNNYAAFLAKAKSTSATSGSSTGNSTSTSNGSGRSVAVSSISTLGALGAFLAFFL